MGQPTQPQHRAWTSEDVPHLGTCCCAWSPAVPSQTLLLCPQAPKTIALFLVVAFGSCLDVAAIQADTPGQLDYNHELQTVGEPPCSLLCVAKIV